MKNNNLKTLFKGENPRDKEMNEPYKVMKADIEFGVAEFSVWKWHTSYQNIHSHNYYQIWYIVCGSCQHCIDNCTFQLSSGDLLLIPPYFYHSMSNGSSDLLIIGIDFTESFFTKKLNNNFFQLVVKPISVRQNERIPNFLAINALENLLYETFNEFHNKKSYYEEIIRVNIYKILILVAREFEKENEIQALSMYQRKIILLSIKHINDKYNEKIKIEDMCELTNMSTAYFSSLFKKVTGQTFVEYVNNLRLDKAKQLLSETDVSITEISYETGFGDSAYFSRVFKNHEGVSPLFYRKQNSKIIE